MAGGVVPGFWAPAIAGMVVGLLCAIVLLQPGTFARKVPQATAVVAFAGEATAIIFGLFVAGEWHAGTPAVDDVAVFRTIWTAWRVTTVGLPVLVLLGFMLVPKSSLRVAPNHWMKVEFIHHYVVAGVLLTGQLVVLWNNESVSEFDRTATGFDGPLAFLLGFGVPMMIQAAMSLYTITILPRLWWGLGKMGAKGKDPGGVFDKQQHMSMWPLSKQSHTMTSKTQ